MSSRGLFVLASGVGVLGLVGYAAYRVTGGPAPARDAARGGNVAAADPPGRPAAGRPDPGVRRPAPRWEVAAPRVGSERVPASVAVPVERDVEIPERVPLGEARAQLEAAMSTLEAAIGDRALTAEEFDRHFRATNDAFAAFSRSIDAADPNERDELEATYQRILEQLADVRVRGGERRAPRPAVQPRVNPDPS